MSLCVGSVGVVCGKCGYCLCVGGCVCRGVYFCSGNSDLRFPFEWRNVENCFLPMLEREDTRASSFPEPRPQNSWTSIRTLLSMIGNGAYATSNVNKGIVNSDDETLAQLLKIKHRLFSKHSTTYPN